MHACRVEQELRRAPERADVSAGRAEQAESHSTGSIASRARPE
jgi:hypothetical protein